MASIKKRPDGVWRARYRDAAGKEYARHFRTKNLARRWLDEVTASVVTGQYVDPKAGKQTFRQYAEQWRAIQPHRPATAELVERHLRRYVYPTIGGLPLASIRQSHLQAMLKGLERDLSPATRAVAWRYVQTIFRAAVRDRCLAKSPCEGVPSPKVNRPRVEPISTAAVHALADAVPERYRALVVLAAGTGLRQGEAFGLTVDRVKFLKRQVVVDRQLVAAKDRVPVFGPPKTESSDRVVPLPAVVADALAAHLKAFPAEPDGLVFTNSEGAPLRRSAFGSTWRRATEAAGADGVVFHSLRHYYASVLIRHGESVKTVQARMGHKSAQETLDTYSHLWPDADDRTREAVDAALLRTPGGLDPGAEGSGAGQRPIGG